MRNFLLLSLLVFSLVPFGNEHDKKNDYAKSDLELYTENHITDFKLNQKLLDQIRINLKIEFSKLNCSSYPEGEFKKKVKEYKQYFLQQRFFKLYPGQGECYKPLPIPSALQTCSNGGFNSMTANNFLFTTFSGNTAAFTGNTYGGVNVQTQNNPNLNFTPTGPNLVNGNVALVSAGPDPTIPILGRTFNGTSGAIRLNNFDANFTNNAIDITTMSRTFICNENTFNYNYSLIVENPPLHIANQQPIFSVRLRNQNNQILRRRDVFANAQDCFFTVAFNQPNGANNLIYSGWVCDQMNTSDLIGQQLTVEFVIGDCSLGGHAGMVYIDEICGTNCSNPTSGGVNLNTIQTIDCPTDNIQICGSYTLPAQGAYSNIDLNITQNGNIVNTITQTSSLNTNNSGGTFCFDVPLSIFGTNPFGSFNFQADMTFLRQCTSQGNIQLNPIFDNSANDFGPDVLFQNCLEANDDNFTIPICDVENFSILDNDLIYGEQATALNSTVNPFLTTGPVNINFSTGLVSFDEENLSTGTYTYSYTLCNSNIPQDCDTGQINIIITEPTISAENDDFTDLEITTCNGGTTDNILSNDSYCGDPLLFGNNVTVEIIDLDGLSGVDINQNNKLEIPPNVEAGNYTLTYKICDENDDENCDTGEISIIVTSPIPNFNFPTTICQGSYAPTLPNISNNGFEGSWSPPEIDVQNSENYTFTPDQSCVDETTVQIEVLQECGLFLSWEGEVGCQNWDMRRRKFADANIENLPCLRFCENSTVNFNLEGQSSSIENTVWEVTGGNIIDQDNFSCEIEWGDAGDGYIDITVTMDDGEVKSLEQCIEKVPEPIAFFNVTPFDRGDIIEVCQNSRVSFDNLSNAAGGDDDLYYKWNFDDANSQSDNLSTEFEPTHIYREPGIYRVELQVSNGCSCTDVIKRTIRVTKPLGPIECVSVTCQGSLKNYTVNGASCRVRWTAQGGEIVNVSGSNDESVSVHWKDVGPEGFGYLTAQIPDCSKCKTTAKIPVVTEKGFISGKEKLCVGEQGLYKLPEWASTVFNWSVVNSPQNTSVTGTDQRNEFVVSSENPGTIKIRCEYRNTLLNCGGIAEYKVEINPAVKLKVPETICKNNNETFIFTDEFGNTIPNTVDYTVTGPDNFEVNGSGVSFTQSFPKPGTYNVNIDSDQYCVPGALTIAVSDLPEEPTAITGETVICPGSALTYNTEVPEGFQAVWEVDNGTINGSNQGNSVSITFDPEANGNYSVSVSYTNGQCTSAEYTINPEAIEPDLDFAQSTTEACASQTYSYAVNSTEAEFYEWTIVPTSAGSIVQGQNSNEVVVLWNEQAGTHSLEIEARKCGISYTESIDVEVITSPEIEIIAPDETCVGAATGFSVNILQGEGVFNEIIWNYGDGSVDTLSNSNAVTHNYMQPLNNSATYTVTATVINANGCPNPAIESTDIVVSPSPIVQLSKSFVNLCSDYGNSVTLNIQSGFGATESIEWFDNSDPGNAIGNLTGNTTVNFENVGEGDYYAVITNTYGCQKQTDLIDVDNCGPTEPAPADCSSLTVQTTKNLGCQEVTLEITGTSAPTNELYFSGLEYLGGNVQYNGNNNVTVSNLDPGYYSVFVAANYDSENSDNECSYAREINFTIPYKAGVKFETTCSSNGQYELHVLDFSVFYGLTPIDQYEFTTDGGNTWQSGTIIGGIPQLVENVSPGTYEIGVRIEGSGYDPCTAFATIDLPEPPNAGFSFANSGCPNEAVQFTPDEINDDWTYEWNFDGPINLNPTPAQNLTPGNNQITLTVSNAYGCSVSTIQSINLNDPKLGGDLNADPEMACEGETLTIDYEPNPGGNMPQTFEWYRGTETEVPYAVTNSPSLDVTEDGQYYVYVQGENGCWRYDNDGTSVTIVPKPDAPKIQGEQITCLGDPIELSVPDIEGITYTWSRNGEEQPQWDGQSEITDPTDTPGDYQYSVVANLDNQDCSSAVGQFTVNLIPEPDTPEIEVQVDNCNPYQVTASVSNVQQGLDYYWSNGDTGPQTTLTHDGPLRVEARTTTCSSSSQIDLPVNLEALGWIFPDGCFSFCQRKEYGQIVPPLGNFDNWAWTVDGSPESNGSGSIPFLNLSGFYGSHSIALELTSDPCSTTFGEADLSVGRCDYCEVKVLNTDFKCISNANFTGYQVDITIDNAGPPLSISFSVPGSEGYFINNSVYLPSGSNNQTFYFQPENNFSGGSIAVLIEGETSNGPPCLTRFRLDFPTCPFLRPGARSQNTSANGIFNFFVTPNPTDGQATAYFKTNGKADRLVVRDLHGRTVWSHNITKAQGKIPIQQSALAPGTYLVSLQQGSQLLDSVKLIIK